MHWNIKYCVGISVIVLLAGAAYAQDLSEAIENGSIDEVRGLIAVDTTLINVADDAGNTPMHLACRGGQIEIAGLLIDAGADLNATNKQSMTPLRLAIYLMKTEIAKLLLDRGAKTDDTHPMFGSLMSQAFAISCQNNGGPESVELLIAHGLTFDGSQVDALGMSPLDWAVHFGDVPMARLAIDHGADVNLVSQRLGRPPLVAAVSKGNDAFVTVLLEHGADVSVVDKYGNPPIFYAVDQGRTAILKELLDHGASTGFTEPHYGRSLFHIAAIKGYRDIAELLAARGGDINAVDRSGKTPAYYAATYENQSVAEVLTERGAARSKDLENHGKSSRQTNELKADEALIVYLNNRGWTVKTNGHLLVFDAEEFEVRRSDNPCLANGFLTVEELKQQNVVSLFSCYHGQPGEPAYIHSLADSLDKIAYVHLVDDAWRGSPNTTYLQGKADTIVADIKIQTIDIAEYMPMLAYMCKVDGSTIYYQAFGTDDPGKLRENYEYLSQFVDTVDIAFLPMPEPEQEESDIRLFLERFPTRSVVLLDTNRREYMYPDAAKQIAEWGFPVEVFCVENPGDGFEFHAAGE